MVIINEQLAQCAISLISVGLWGYLLKAKALAPIKVARVLEGG